MSVHWKYLFYEIICMFIFVYFEHRPGGLLRVQLCLYILYILDRDPVDCYESNYVYIYLYILNRDPVDCGLWTVISLTMFIFVYLEQRPSGLLRVQLCLFRAWGKKYLSLFLIQYIQKCDLDSFKMRIRDESFSIIQSGGLIWAKCCLYCIVIYDQISSIYCFGQNIQCEKTKLILCLSR